MINEDPFERLSETMLGASGGDGIPKDSTIHLAGLNPATAK
jgi:hypothetical protein